jgi:hypothetical protein
VTLRGWSEGLAATTVCSGGFLSIGMSLQQIPMSLTEVSVCNEDRSPSEYSTETEAELQPALMIL